ncbi:uncharacterized protein LOC144344448 [Saccoglossus kowalevskii]
MTEVALAAVKDRLKIYTELFVEGKLAEMSEMCTQDYKLMPPSLETVDGRKAIQDFLQSFKASGVHRLQSTVVDIGVIGDDSSVYEWSDFKTYKSDGSVLGKGTYLHIWKKIDGVYYLHRDIFNTFL